MRDRVMITAPFSDSGKTVLTLAIHKALQMSGYKTVSFKVGPDYLDPRMHRELLSIPAYNLDSFFMKKEWLCQTIADAEGDLAIVEGAMGYYDGIGYSTAASSYEIARLTDTPVVLVIDARKSGLSVAAVLKGFQEYIRPSRIRGVIFNRLPATRYSSLKGIIEELGIRSLGYFPEIPEAVFSSHYLGLRVPESESFQSQLQALGEQALSCIDLDAFLKIAGEAPSFSLAEGNRDTARESFRLALAEDEAFTFLYRENIDYMKRLGAEIVPFSPLRDKTLPPEADALYLPGGYPEQFAVALAQNTGMLTSVKEAISSGMPCIAEGGGFLYLHNHLEGEKLVGLIPAEAKVEKKRQGFGYHYLTPTKDALIGFRNRKIASRRFHYCSSSAEGEDYFYRKVSGESEGRSGYSTDNLYASFFTLCFPGIAEEMEHFVEKVMSYRNRIM